MSMRVDLSSSLRPNLPLLTGPLDADDHGADNEVLTDMLNDLRLCEELFHTSSGVGYVAFITDGHRETWPIRSKRFRTWVRRCYYRATGAAPGAAVLGPALDLLEARAQFDGPERVVHTRLAEHAARLNLTLPTSVGVQSRSDRMVGSLHRPRSASVGPRVCCRCPCLSAADQLKPFARS
jgi:hypothetical protein